MNLPGATSGARTANAAIGTSCIAAGAGLLHEEPTAAKYIVEKSRESLQQYRAIIHEQAAAGTGEGSGAIRRGTA